MIKKHLLKELSKADYITLLAVLLIINSFWLLWNEEIYLAISLAFVSMYLDFLDGFVARKYGGSDYGKVLDTLYDVLGWVLFPALVINIEARWAWWSLLITTIFCLASVIRLSRFTVSGYVEKNKKYYTGLPVLFSKYALLTYLLFDAKISLLILIIMIPLMVSSKLIKKPHAFFAQLELLYAVVFLTLYFIHA
jgi:CDP-diacylglycerol--serine O-phosphatidyltransferase